MRKLEGQRIEQVFAIGIAISFLFSSVTLWLIESPIKYLLFLFEAFTIMLLLLIMHDYDFHPNPKWIRFPDAASGVAIGIFLVLGSVCLWILNVSFSQGGAFQIALTLICSSILSGYCLLNVSGLEDYFSNLENVVLSVVLGYAFTALLNYAAILATGGAQPLMVLGGFVALGLLSIFRHRGRKVSALRPSFARNADLLAVLLVTAFYVLSFYLMYPGFTLLTNSDILRHYASSVVLGRTPDLYSGSSYLIFHLFESAFLKLSGASFADSQLALILLNLILPLAFYAMAKAHLEEVDKRLPALATVFWVAFTNGIGGFAWLDFASLKLSMNGMTELQLLGNAADATYNGTIYGIFGLWFLPTVLSFTGLMVTISLIRRMEIPRRRYVALFSVLIATLYLTHVTEAVLLAIFLSLFGALSRSENIRIDDSIGASILGFLSAIIAYAFLSLLSVRFVLDLSQTAALVGSMAALLLSLLLRKIVRPRLPTLRSGLLERGKPLLVLSILFLGFLYLIAFLSWASVKDSFHTWQVAMTGFVPWVMFPLLLGANGLLAVLFLYHFMNAGRSYRMLTFLASLLAFTFIAGRIISAVNLSIEDTGYLEYRLIWLLEILLACFAPLPVMWLCDSLRARRVHPSLKTIATVATIGIIVLGGASTTFLNLEYWNTVSNYVSLHPTAPEIDAIHALSTILDRDPRAWVLTTSDASADLLIFSAPSDTLGLRQLLYTANTAEMAFILLYRNPAYSHPYIYIENRDLAILDSQGSSLLGRYLSMLPVVFNNSAVQIYNATKYSFTQAKSDTALVIPFDKTVDGQDTNLAYNILSQGFYDYTSFYDLDNKALNAKTIILPIDPPNGNILSSTYNGDFSRGFGVWNVVNGIWRTQNGELIGGENGQYTQGTILSPRSSGSFNASFRVTPTSGNITVANYARLIFSWIDSNNYSVADILFNTDGYIYALFRVYSGGIERDLPTWPGVKSNFKWTVNQGYDVTVGVTDNLDQLSINGVQLLSANSPRAVGMIGLGYLRFFDVSFSNVSIVTSTIVDLRPISDYLGYLQLGGKIVILNTNGYGYFADKLFRLSNSSLVANAINGPSFKASFSPMIRVPKLSITDQNTTTQSVFISQNDSSPYISQTKYGKGELTYVNLYPISKSIIEDGTGPAFYWMLGRLLDDLKLDRLSTNALPSIDGYVRQVYLSNQATATTQSLMFPLGFIPRQLDAKSENGTITFLDPANLSITSGSNLIVQTAAAMSEPGQGLYALMHVSSTFTVSPSNGTFNLSLIAGGQKHNISNILQIIVTPGDQTNLLMRTPTLRAQHVTFLEFYPFGGLQSSTRTYGENLIVDGPTEFSIGISDSYSALNNVSLGNSFQRDPPLTSYNDLTVLPTVAFWIVSSIPLLIAVIAISVVRSREERYATT